MFSELKQLDPATIAIGDTVYRYKHSHGRFSNSVVQKCEVIRLTKTTIEVKRCKDGETFTHTRNAYMAERGCAKDWYHFNLISPEVAQSNIDANARRDEIKRKHFYRSELLNKMASATRDDAEFAKLLAELNEKESSNG